MSVLTTPSNPHNNVTPNMLTQANYTDPITLAAEMASRRGLPKEQLDKVYTDCEDLVKESWLGFLDMFQMNVGIKTNSLEFIETETPDYVIDDDGAVTRAVNVFTIDWSAVQGYETGEDAFFFRVDDTVMVVDNTGKKEIGVITAIDKANDTFTAVCRNGANWTVATTNLSIDVTGSDHDRASCGPEGLMELRKKKSRVLKLINIKDAMQASGGERWAFEDENGDVKWYDENTIALMKRLNHKISKSLMLEIESASGSAAFSAGKYGTQGLFDNLEKNGLLNTGYITTLAHLQAITNYWDSLGYKNKEFIAHVDRVQFRHFEQIAAEIATNLGIQLQAVLNNAESNYSRFGFHSLTADGYTIHFTKWGLTDGNSPLGKKRIKDVMPKGIIMPTGTIKTVVNGQEMNVPYIFKAYQDMAGMGVNSAGMIRTFLSGGFNGDGDCEYSKITKSTTVAIAVPCPEAVTIIK